jgi:hypothetical protein
MGESSSSRSVTVLAAMALSHGKCDHAFQHRFNLGGASKFPTAFRLSPASGRSASQQATPLQCSPETHAEHTGIASTCRLVWTVPPE